MEVRMKSCGIIFDCDGTLVNSVAKAFESFHYALAQMGEKPRSSAEIERYFGAGADRILTRILGDEQRGLEAFQHYIDHQTELAHQTELHQGIRELLAVLAEAGVPLAVVTGRHARDLDVLLAPHKLSDYFVTLVADNQIPHSKPAPDGVLMAAKRMGLLPENTFYIGDAVYDIRAARAAGSVAVAAVWDPLARPQELLAEHPDCVAHSPDEVWTHFRRIFGIQ